jgi:hypothetical protein
MSWVGQETGMGMNRSSSRRLVGKLDGKEVAKRVKK